MTLLIRQNYERKRGKELEGFSKNPSGDETLCAKVKKREQVQDA
jgi:hypothetical protein